MTSPSPAPVIDNHPLGFWAAPRSWFRLIYAVWFDQRWYWQQVRPHLQNQRLAWRLLIQTILGSFCLSCGFIAIPIAALWATRSLLHIYEGSFRLGAIFILCIPLAFGLLGGFFHRPERGIPLAAASVSYSLAYSIIVPIALLVLLTVPIDTNLEFSAHTAALPFGLGLALPNLEALGIVLGLSEVLTKGELTWNNRKPIRVPSGPIWRTVFGSIWFVTLILRGVGAILTDWRYSMSGIWFLILLISSLVSLAAGELFVASLAMRQIESDELRRKLAKPQ
jgi:hypothetical protein